MMRFRLSGLRIRLVLLVLLAVIPLLALILYNAADERNAAAHRAQSDALRVAQLAAANQQQFVEPTRQLLVRLAQLSNVRLGDPPACTAVFSELQAQFLQQSPRYANLGLIDPNGNIYCSVQPVSGPVNVADRTYFQRAVQTLNFSIGDYEFDPATGVTLVNFGYPVLDFGGRTRVVIFAALDLAWLNPFASQVQLPDGFTFTVIDRSGTILIRHPDAARWVGKTVPTAPIVDAILTRRGEGTAEAIDFDGVPRLHAFTTLSSTPGDAPAAYVSIGIPTEVIFAESNRILVRSLLTLTIATLLALGATWAAGDLFVLRPVRALVQATRRLSAGDLSARTGLSAEAEQGELGQLARAFDQMAEALQQRQIERERAEHELQKSEELYRTLARNFPNGAVILFDHDLRYTLADGAGLAEVGLSKEMLEGKTIWELFPPDTAAILEPHYRAALAGDAATFEVPFADRMYLVHTLPLRNERGDIFAGMAMTQDITERKRAEEALQTSEARFRSAFDDAAVGMTLVSPDGRFLQVNRACCDIVGYDESELLGMTFQSITHPDDLAADVDQFNQLLSGAIRHYEMEKRLLHKRGRVAWVLLSVSLVRDAQGRPLYTVSQLQDVAQRKQAEEELREKEEQYRGIFESTSDGLVINAMNTGQVVEANPAFCAMHGYTREELVGIDPRSFIHPDSHHLFEEYVRTVQAGGQFEARAVDVHKDGTPFHIEVRGSRLIYKGKPHMLGVVRDITERVQAQQLLEQRVEERTRELTSLLEISRNVASTLELEPLLGLILEQLKTVVDYSGAAVLTVEGEVFKARAYRGPVVQEMALRSKHSVDNPLDREIIDRRPVIIPDVRDETPLARAFRESVGEPLETAYSYIRSWMGVPLMIKEWVIGMLSLDHGEPNYYTVRHARLALAIASQAAIAIENAKLYEQAQQLAALEERQRLARELHDSVSQALYGIALGARTARTLLDRDPGGVAEPLDYVLSLAEAGLAEMRALIFELRPESLATEGLVAALTKQAAFVRARHGVDVHTALCDEPDLPVDAKSALYRIAQEALHNTVKHARATRAEIRLDPLKDEPAIVLEVKDNGQGFDARASFPGHLGLRSMRERAEKAGGTLEVDSAPDSGTRIQVRIPFRAA